MRQDSPGIVKKNVPGTAGLYKKASLLYKENRLYDAVSILQKLVRHPGYGDRSAFLLAQCYDRLSYLTDEQDYEDRTDAAYRELLARPLKRRMIKKTEALYRAFTIRTRGIREREESAYRKARQLLNEGSASSGAWLILGTNFDIRKDIDFVISAYRHALRLNPSSAEALFRLGYIYDNNLHDPESARKYYRELVKLHPGDDPAEAPAASARYILNGCNQLSGILYREGLYRDILSIFQHALSINSDYFNLGAFYSMNDLIYFADMAVSHTGMREDIDMELQKVYHVSLHYLVNKYCRRISVA